jgi:epoxyqueuosine reductase QueG
METSFVIEQIIHDYINNESEFITGYAKLNRDISLCGICVSVCPIGKNMHK